MASNRLALGTLVTSSAAGTVTINRPSGVADTDMLLFTVTVRGTALISGPAGARQLHNSDGGAILHASYVVQAGTATSYDLSSSDSINIFTLVGAYIGADAATTWTATPAINQATPTTPSVTAAAGDVLVSAVSQRNENVSFTPPAGVSERVDGGVGSRATNWACMAAGDEARTTAGATGTRTWSTAGWTAAGNVVVSVLVKGASVAETPPDVPGAPTATAVDHQSTSVTIPDAARAATYDLRVNGATVITGVTRPYTHSGLTLGGSYSYEARAVNAAGTSAWSAPSNTVTLPAAPQYLRPTADGTIGGTWTVVGAATFAAALADESDASYIVTPLNPDATVYYSAVLAAGNPPDTLTPVVLRVRADKDAGARTIDLVAEVRQGDGTVISTLSMGTLNSNAPTSYETTLTTTEVAAIANWADVRVRVNPSTAGGGSGSAARIYRVELQAPAGTPPAAPPTGTAAGAWAFTGTASGSSPRNGTAGGGWLFVGAAQGSSPRAGSASASWTFTGAAAGTTDRSGNATGAWTFGGAASGSAPAVGGASGTATGTWTFTGSATGATTRTGASTGAWGFAGTAAGASSRSGTAAGAWGFAGTAAGTTDKRGAATGTWAYDGSATGAAPAVDAAEGTATGSWAFAGAAQGKADKFGAGQGTWTFTGQAAGTAPAVGVSSGFTTGQWSFTGTATGTTTRSGTATGAWAFIGTATGTTPEVGVTTGTAAGTWTFTGTAAGQSARTGTAVGGWVFTSTADGVTTRAGTAQGVWVYVGDAAGRTPVVEERTNYTGATTIDPPLGGASVLVGAAGSTVLDPAPSGTTATATVSGTTTVDELGGSTWLT